MCCRATQRQHLSRPPGRRPQPMGREALRAVASAEAAGAAGAAALPVAGAMGATGACGVARHVGAALLGPAPAVTSAPGQQVLTTFNFAFHQHLTDQGRHAHDADVPALTSLQPRRVRGTEAAIQQD